MEKFRNSAVNIEVLRQQAFNLRWAEVPNDVIPLTAADLDFPVAEPIKEAIFNYTKKGYFNYAPAFGLPEFKESYSNFLTEKRSVTISPNQILPVDSAAFGIYLTCKAILNKGDEAIVFNPVDFLFKYSIQQVGGIAKDLAINPTSNQLDFEALEQLVTPKTKLICLCNPLNPTGKVFTKNELQALSDFALKHQLIVLSDEIWSDIVFHPNSYTSIAALNSEIANSTIIVSGFSKSYGLAGLRIGVVATANAELFQRIQTDSLHSSTVHGANALGQIAATAALNDSQDWLHDFILHLTRNRTFIHEKIAEITTLTAIQPEGCYVYFINVTQTGFTSLQAQEFLLKEAKVAVVPGLPQWFGTQAEGYIRISFATSYEIVQEAFTRIQNALLRV